MDGPAPSCPSGGIVLDNEGPPGATLELVAGRDKNAPSVSVPRHLAAKHARLLGRMLDNDSTVTSTTVQFDTSTLKQVPISVPGVLSAITNIHSVSDCRSHRSCRWSLWTGSQRRTG